MLCPVRLSANNNSRPAPRRRGYSLDSDREPESSSEGNTIGAATDTRQAHGLLLLGLDVAYFSVASPWSLKWTRGVVVVQR